MKTILRQKCQTAKMGEAEKKRMEGYKFSTNWLPFRTQKPDDDRYSAPQANTYRGRYLMLQFHLFLLVFSFSTFCELAAAPLC